ncbi:ATP-binding protein [Sulfurimonas aquatica]|uniref:ATP-binding protein n=1 Tax=Sulfurimonas aquatica TaxID=2672570 RepID=A0A975AYQ7_9BACT|nr:dynamin family protein [Sulfurimonas aquatica]QSZ41057.1 ATP-binding protein [Sulfurimonas aquatica]
MKHLQNIVREYKETYLNEELFDDTISGEIKHKQKLLLDEKFLPSVGLKSLFNKLLRRSTYPMEVAIVGQFSSGKSTFLNALLSKDILPTGITPVTSKVNYINYSDEYKLKVTYNNGADEYHPLESISNFTDQRYSMEDVKYITLYAPMEILKDISFVDTPGLNSQSLSDTQVTKKILRDVDGIIWLTLLDNAGKESESQVLSEYLENFKDKSLCVLNQKDKFDSKQVETTVGYMQMNFKDFFVQVIPISAKQALDSRVNQKDVLINSALISMQKSFNETSKLYKNEDDLSFFQKEFEIYSENIKAIQNKDNSKDKELMKESNISEVLDFIENTIRPQAKASKEYSIKKELQDICDILIKEYESILGVYESLVEILKSKESEVLVAFDSVTHKHSKALSLTYRQMESIVESVRDAIYENIKQKQSSYYKVEKGIFAQSSIKRYDYESTYVDGEAIMSALFYNNQSLDKQINSALAYSKSIEKQSSEDLKGVFRILKYAIQLWQEPYELIKKHREIASDLEFANTRQFVSKAYENIILPYHRLILTNITYLQKNFAYFHGAFAFSYKQVTQEAIFLIQQKIDIQTTSFEKDPLKYSLSTPTSDEIMEIVKESFSFDKVEAFLTSKRNYLFKTIERSKEEFLEVNTQQIEYVTSKKEIYEQKIKELKDIKLNKESNE